MINDVYLSVQASMRDFLRVNGDNTLPVAHLRKDYLRARNQLPESLYASEDLMSKAYKFLDDPDKSDSDSSDDEYLNVPIFPPVTTVGVSSVNGVSSANI